MSASLTSQKDLSKIAFLWSQFFSEDQKGSFTQLIANWRFSRELENIETKNTVAKLLEHDLIIEDIIFEFLLDTNIDSLKCRYCNLFAYTFACHLHFLSIHLQKHL